jgi:hypothetical protein
MLPIKETEIKDGRYKPRNLYGKRPADRGERFGGRSPGANRLRRAQTQGSLIHFSIGDDWMTNAGVQSIEMPASVDANTLTRDKITVDQEAYRLRDFRCTTPSPKRCCFDHLSIPLGG